MWSSRRPITQDDAVEVCIRYMRGEKILDLAVHYCKPDWAIHDILSGRTHKGAQEIAVQMYNKHGAKYGLKPKAGVRDRS